MDIVTKLFLVNMVLFATVFVFDVLRQIITRKPYSEGFQVFQGAWGLLVLASVPVWLIFLIINS